MNFFTLILFLLLTLKVQLSVSGKRMMCTSTGEMLRMLSLPKKNVISLTDQIDNFTVLTGSKPKHFWGFGLNQNIFGAHLK